MVILSIYIFNIKKKYLLDANIILLENKILIYNMEIKSNYLKYKNHSAPTKNYINKIYP